MGPFHTAPDPMETTVRTAAHPDVFADRHLGPTEAERAAMLETLGFDSLDALADAIDSGADLPVDAARALHLQRVIDRIVRAVG